MKYQILTALILSSCVTAPSKPSYEKSTVLELIGDRTETPEWAHGEQSMVAAGADVHFIYFTTVAGNSRPDGCLNQTTEQARGASLRYIKDSIVASGHLDDRSITEDPGYESLIAFLSYGSLSGASVASRYWEKREESAESGERVLRLRCAVKLAVKRADLDRQLRQAIGQTGNKEIHDKLNKLTSEALDSFGLEKTASVGATAAAAKHTKGAE